MDILSNPPETIAFLGQTGAGKTSLINTLFDLDWFVDPALSSTKKIHRYTGKISRNINASIEKLWTVVDTPGVGESEMADETYFSMLCETFDSCKTLIWVVQANTRAYAEDQIAILNIVKKKPLTSITRCFVAINQIDKIYPENWNFKNNQPSSEQQEVIDEKIEFVYSRFNDYLPIEKDCIFPVSAQKTYGLDKFICSI